jgi:hypothetical protein
MSERDLLLSWLVIVVAVIAFWRFVVLTLQAENTQIVDRLVALAKKHKENMASDDAERVAESKKRWRQMCVAVSRTPRAGHVALALMDIGAEIEKEGER